VSTKPGTVVQLFPRGELATAERLATAKPTKRGVSRLGVTALSLNQSGQLASQERGHRETALRGEHTSLAQSLLVEREGNVANFRHEGNV
jgi:hypothetical protein